MRNQVKQLHERFLFQWSILPLLDNDATDEFVYEVHVYTGLKSNSGTDSKVSLIVAGTVSDSGIRKLEDGVREKPFESGGVTFGFGIGDGYGGQQRFGVRVLRLGE